ncbi:MAG: hypothetical protein ACRYGF_02175 [Janthinobacterium lividum]
MKEDRRQTVELVPNRASEITGKRRLYDMAAAVLLAGLAATSISQFMAARRTPLLFDDAYMFLRYAENLRHGLGYAWNPDGVHTYGPTSLLWSAATLLLSYLPAGAWTQLITGSWLCSVAALIAIAWAVATNARRAWLRSTWRVLPLVALPLAGTAAFEGNQFTGMETMLAMALCGIFTGVALRWRAGRALPVAVGLAAMLLLLARPESAIVGLLLPALLWWCMEGPRPPVRELATLYGVFLGAAALELLLCQWYFGTPVPLSVFLKGGHAYRGYAGVWHPELLLTVFLRSCQVFLAALLLLARRRDYRLLLCCLIPAAAVFVYLQAVTQIMGFNARYYAPYLPLVIVPALLLLDRHLTDRAWNSFTRRSLYLRSGLVAALILCLLLLSSEAVQGTVRQAEHRCRDAYDSADLRMSATQPLPPHTWQETMQSITDDLIAPLPPGTTVAATEVGYLGQRAAAIHIIDLAGLNDTDIALHGFRMDALLARKPDIIWMPNTEYTYQRGVMYSDPALLREYDIYAGAANYGIALRKDSPFRAAIDRQMNVFWQRNYPGFQQGDYLVQAATWTGAKHTVCGE